jgi:hypothetical protein
VVGHTRSAGRRRRKGMMSTFPAYTPKTARDRV